MRRPRGSPGCEDGFTLLELLIVVAILGIVAGVGVPQYVSALRVARVGKSKHDLVTISHAIDAFAASNAGQLPLSLHQVGFGGKSDPWGVPYCYLNYADGTGDGLEWAIAAGLVDPSAIVASGGGSTTSTSTGGSGTTTPRMRHAGFVLSASWPQGTDDDSGLRGRTAARTTATAVASRVTRTLTPTETETLVDAVAAATSFSLFTNVNTETTRRRDRYMFPLNTDYDLFSLGPNGRTTVSLGESLGQDDVIRANNGGFFGTASDY